MYKSIVLTLLVAAVLGGVAKQFDWRNVGGITGTGDEGLCDSSVGWTVATMYETEYYRQTATLPVTSVEYLLECAPSMSCSPGSSTYQNLYSVADWTANNGLALDSAWPYTAGATTSGKPSTPGICSAALVKAPKKIKVYKEHKISTGGMKKWIAKNPVGAMVYADSGFQGINNGNVYSCSTNSPSDSQLNRAVTAIGYTSDTNYIIQNSKGTGFGSGGYATLKKDSECGLRRRVVRYNFGVQAVVTALLVLVSLVAF